MKGKKGLWNVCPLTLKLKLHSISRKRKEQRTPSLRIGRRVFSVIGFGVVSLMVFCILAANFSQQPISGASSVSIRADKSNKFGYSNTEYSLNFIVTRDGKEYAAFCGESFKDNPSDGVYASETYEPKTQTGRLMKLALAALEDSELYNYYYVPIKFPKPTNSLGYTFTYAGLAHNVLSLVYTGRDDELGKPSSMRAQAVELINRMKAQINSDSAHIITLPSGKKIDLDTDYQLYRLVTPSQVQYVFWVEHRPPMWMKITKQDIDLKRLFPQGDASMEGTTLAVYKDGAVAKDTSGHDAVFTVQNNTLSPSAYLLGQGNYELREMRAGTGYALDSKAYNFSLNDNDATSHNSPSTAKTVINFQNRPIRGGVQIRKCDKELVNGTDNPAMISACSQGDASVEGIKRISASEQASPCATGGSEVCATITTDKHGFAKTSLMALPYGSYEIREVASNATYFNDKKPATIKFTIREDGKMNNIASQWFKNSVFRGGIKIRKCDTEVSSGKPLDGEEENLVCAQGDANVENIHFGIYNKSALPAIIDRDGDGIISDAEKKNPCPNDNKTVCYELWTDKYGFASTPQRVFPVGTYEVREINPNSSYLLEPFNQKRTARILKDGSMIDVSAEPFANKVERGGIKIRKVDTEWFWHNIDKDNEGTQGDSSIAGIRFAIYNMSKLAVSVDPSGQDSGEVIDTGRRSCEPVTIETVRNDDAAQKACAIISTDENGYAATSNTSLPEGRYAIRELPSESNKKYANPSYLYNAKNLRTFSISKDTAKNKEMIDFVSDRKDWFLNKVIRGDVKAYKGDIETQKFYPLGKASFKDTYIAIWNHSKESAWVTGADEADETKDFLGFKNKDFECKTLRRRLMAHAGAAKAGRNNNYEDDFNIKDACLVLRMDQGDRDDLGYFWQSLAKTFPVGRYVWREVDPAGRPKAHKYSNKHGYFLTDAQIDKHYFNIVNIGEKGITGQSGRDGQVAEFKGKLGAVDAAAFNQIRRGDFHFTKRVEDCEDEKLNGNVLPQIAFMVTSKTTGESHILITDKNGYADTAKDWIDNDNIEAGYGHATNVNDRVIANKESCIDGIKRAKGQEKAAEIIRDACRIDEDRLALADPEARVWFGQDEKAALKFGQDTKEAHRAPVDNSKVGALPYDNYLLTELRSSKNQKYKLIHSDISIDKDKSNVNKADLDVGTITNKPCENCSIIEKIIEAPKTGFNKIMAINDGLIGKTAIIAILGAITAAIIIALKRRSFRL